MRRPTPTAEAYEDPHFLEMAGGMILLPALSSPLILLCAELYSAPHGAKSPPFLLVPIRSSHASRRKTSAIREVIDLRLAHSRGR